VGQATGHAIVSRRSKIPFNVRSLELGLLSARAGQTSGCDAAPSHFHTQAWWPVPADPTEGCISRGLIPGVLLCGLLTASTTWRWYALLEAL